MCDPALSVFFLMFSAFTLLTLIVFSVPFISSFHFLHTTLYGGVKFGIWGWCFDLSGVCSTKQFGYTWVPQINDILIKLHILYPIAAGLTLVSSMTLIPVMCTRHIKLYPFPLFSILSLLSFITSTTALIVSVITWVLAKKRFEQDNVAASLGPCIWMSVAATGILMLLAVTSGCGTLCRGRWGRRTWDIVYTY